MQGSRERTVTEDRRPPRSLGDAKPDSGTTPTGPAKALGGRISLGPISARDGMAAAGGHPQPGPRARPLCPETPGVLLHGERGGAP
jgi:hypothetical protein